MDSSDLFDNLWIIVWLVLTIFSFFSKKKKEASAEPARDPQEVLEEIRRRLLEASGEREARDTRLRTRAVMLVRSLETFAEHARSDRRLASIAAAIDGILPRARALVASIEAEREDPAAEYTLEKLERAASFIETILRQRSADETPELRAGERVAELAAAPFVEFCRVQGIAYDARPFLAVRHAGRVDRSLHHEELPFSLVPVSADARNDPRAMPMVAREVGETIFFGVPGLGRTLASGLSLPEALALPSTAHEVRPAYLRAAFGPYLPDLFADLYATSLFGPAYAEALFALAEHPGVRRAAHRMQSYERWISPHPPLALRFAFVLEVLEALGRVSEAKRLRARWDRLFEGVTHYLFPAIDGSAAKIPVEFVQKTVAAMASRIIEFHHPTLEGFRILDIPGLGYLHAEHSAVVRSTKALLEERVPHERPLLVIAAAALLAQEKPALSPQLAELARRALRGDHRVTATAPKARRPAQSSRGIAAMMRDPETLAEAVALGAALGRRPTMRR